MDQPVNDAIDSLQLLRRMGFGGRRIFGDHGRTMTLHYRRTWCGISDVVLVYDEYDAEAYRCDDSFDDRDPFGLVAGPDLLEEAVGEVVDVVQRVREWPPPDWSGYTTTESPAR
ncbi:hypothetical protein [Amycolatopsis thailandensis]|uniref:hypothetical protein n=1 Tax=Amycolatopsis thailandensis TaxID=589330 RepID=UPI003633360C